MSQEDYRVTVVRDSEDVLEWSGWAENITDALHKALDKHEEKLEADYIESAERFVMGEG